MMDSCINFKQLKTGTNFKTLYRFTRQDGSDLRASLKICLDILAYLRLKQAQPKLVYI